MTKMKVISALLALIGIVGAVLSVVMVISAIQFYEWGRVILYCVTLAVCVELSVLNIMNLKPKKNEE